jgi:hypothetical protein
MVLFVKAKPHKQHHNLPKINGIKVPGNQFAFKRKSLERMEFIEEKWSG